MQDLPADRLITVGHWSYLSRVRLILSLIQQPIKKLWDYLTQYSALWLEKVTQAAARLLWSKLSGACFSRMADCRVWPTNFHRAAPPTPFLRGLGWAKTSRSLPTRSKKCSAPTRSGHWPEKWVSILRKRPVFWRNTCRRSWTNLHLREKSIQTSII